MRTRRFVAGTTGRCGLPSPCSVQTGRVLFPVASWGSVLRFSLDFALVLIRQENIHSHLLDFLVGKHTLFLLHEPKTALTSVGVRTGIPGIGSLAQREWEPVSHAATCYWWESGRVCKIWDVHSNRTGLLRKNSQLSWFVLLPHSRGWLFLCHLPVCFWCDKAWKHTSGAWVCVPTSRLLSKSVFAFKIFLPKIWLI